MGNVIWSCGKKFYYHVQIARLWNYLNRAISDLQMCISVVTVPPILSKAFVFYLIVQSVSVPNNDIFSIVTLLSS